jgi:transposase
MRIKTFSKDLRVRVIQYIEEGNTQLKASKLFKVSKSAVNRWWKRYQEEGSFEARRKIGSKGKIDQKELEQYVRKHPDETLAQIAANFKVTGVAIWRRLKKLGFSYKKKRSPTWNQMSKSDRCT